MSEPGLRRIAAQRPLAKASAAVLFLTLALALVVPNALDTGVTALVLLALIWLPKPDCWRRHDLHRLERFFLISCAVFIVAWLMAWVFHGLPEGGTGTAQRLPKLLALIPIFLLLRRVEGLESAWWNGLVAGSMIAGGYALWFQLTGQTSDYGSRVNGPVNPIYFGGFAMAYALMLIPRLADDRVSTVGRSLAGLAIILAFVANALSGSRGAWLAIPVLLAVYLFTAGVRQPLRLRLGVPAAVLFLSLTILYLPTLPMSERLSETLLELSLLAEGHNGQGGIGLRVQLWDVAAGLIQAEPLSGTGAGSFRTALVESIQAGNHDPALLRYDHPHNQYLSALIEGGPVLLAMLLMLLLGPVLLVSPLSRRYPRQCRYMAWCALAATVTIAVLALSESLFERNGGVVWVAFLLAVTTALACGSERALSQPTSRT